MKKSGKAILATVCALALAAGSALAASGITTRTLQAQYMGITLKVNGQTVTPTDAKGNPAEPFVVDGTTYVPVRAIGEAMGKRVEWDSATNTVSVGLAPMEEDARQLIDTIESAHPAFALDAVPAGYDHAKAALLETATDPACTTIQFCWAAMAYTASLNDGHTALNVFGNSPQPRVDLGWAAEGDHLYLTDAKGAVTKTEILAVGGLSVKELFAALDSHVPSENQAARDWNHAQWGGIANILYLAGAQLGGNGSNVTLKLSDGTEKTVGFAYPETVGSAASVSAEKMGGVFYVDMNQCIMDGQNTAVAQQLAQAVKDGTKKVIIDVRGNGGGNSGACVELLEAMGMEPPQYGGTVRYSPLAQAQRGYQEADGLYTEEAGLAGAKQNPNIKLVVLTDEDTFSSATMLAVYVRDAKLGTVIGRPSANSPNHYGDILRYTLGNTGVPGTVAHVRWQRPDVNADPNVLIPDIVTPLGTDSLQTALDFLAK